MIDTTLRDLRFVFRCLRRRAGYAALATVTLAVGIGSNMVAASLLQALIVAPHPFPALEELVLFEERRPDNSSSSQLLTPGDVRFLEAEAVGFSGMSSYRFVSRNLSFETTPERVRTFAVGARFFELLGIPPSLGRALGPDDVSREAVVSSGLWTRLFGNRKNVIGETITLDGAPHTIVGVMPETFNFPLGAEVWTPLVLAPTERSELTRSSVLAVARLEPDHDIATARVQLRDLSERLANSYPDTHRGRQLSLFPLRQEQYRYTIPFFLLLQTLAVFVLILSCANTSNLMLTRWIDRRREIATRTSLGATWLGVFRASWLEAITVCLLALALAIPLARWGVAFMKTAMPHEIATFVAGWWSLSVDARIIGASVLGVVCVASLLSLSTSSRPRPGALAEALAGSGRGAIVDASARLAWIRAALTSFQLGIALVLLAGAVFLVSGFRNVMHSFQVIEPERECSPLDSRFRKDLMWISKRHGHSFNGCSTAAGRSPA